MNICQFSNRNRHLVRNRRSRYFVNRTVRKLKLDGEQQRNLNALQAALTAHREYYAENLSNTKAAFDVLIKARSFDRVQATRLLELMNLAHAAHTQELVDSFGDFYDQLGGSQQEVLRAKWLKHVSCNKRFH